MYLLVCWRAANSPALLRREPCVKPGLPFLGSISNAPSHYIQIIRMLLAVYSSGSASTAIRCWIHSKSPCAHPLFSISSKRSQPKDEDSLAFEPPRFPSTWEPGASPRHSSTSSSQPQVVWPRISFAQGESNHPPNTSTFSQAQVWVIPSLSAALPAVGTAALSGSAHPGLPSLQHRGARAWQLTPFGSYAIWIRFNCWLARGMGLIRQSSSPCAGDPQINHAWVRHAAQLKAKIHLPLLLTPTVKSIRA